MPSKLSALIGVALVTLFLVVAHPPASARNYAKLRFYNSQGSLLTEYNQSGRGVTLPAGTSIRARVSDVEKQTGKMRLVTSGDCGGRSSTDTSRPFEFAINPQSAGSRCEASLIGWQSGGWRWRGAERFNITFSASAPNNGGNDNGGQEPPQSGGDNSGGETPNNPRPPRPRGDSGQPNNPPSNGGNTPPRGSSGSTLYRVTQGSGGRTSMGGRNTSRSNHGVRIYCPPSHFAYDDPVIFPNQAGRSHLHLFIGNTEAQANSTPSSLLRSGNSSCEGGVNVRSSYWTPAVINGQGEAVIPGSAWIYYKTFMARNAYNDLQPVPNGLQMLADKATKGYKDQIKISRSTRNAHTGKQSLKLTLLFPDCIATRNGQWNGQPVLDYRDMPGQASRVVNSHVAYSESGSGPTNHLGCPTTHPYRIPTMSIHQYYHLEDLRGGWKLSSDIEKGRNAGETLHADYIAAWDPNTMRAITDCNRFARTCGFGGGRRQLPERLRAPDGDQIYDFSHVVSPNADRTPFGRQLRAMR